MAAYTIDTLATARKLQEAGFESRQAEAVAEAVAHQGEQLATKADITGVRGEVAGVRGEVAGLRWTFGIVAGFVVALNLVMFGFMYQGNQQITQQITQLTQQVGHLSGVVEQWPRQ